MMTHTILKAIAQENPYSYEELYAAYQRLWSIDALMVAIELAQVTELELSEAVDVIWARGRIEEGI